MELKLYYLNAGERRYDTHRIEPYAREHWEFQAVLRGRIGAVLEDGRVDWGERALWAFAPGCGHGWTGAPGRVAEVMVFHLSDPDHLLAGEVERRGGMLRIGLAAAGRAWIKAQGEQLRGDYANPDACSFLKVSHLLTGLSLLLLRGSGYQPRMDVEQLGRERVDRALYWYRQNLERNPAVERVAAAVGVSAVHLRRLFSKVAGQSPKRAFQAIRMAHARAVLRDRRLTVEAVAARLNFADASSFARAYRAHFGEPPRG
jgi:AraC-like DNA-binding protein